MSQRTCIAPLLVLLVVIFLPPSVLAESKRGRYPDGTAYRTDTQGYKLADHIAELEVTVDDLRKQVAALEDELASKDRKLSKAATGQAAIPVTETSLTASTGKTSPALAESKPVGTVIDAQCHRQSEELARELGQLQLAQQAMRTQQENCQQQSGVLRDQVTQLQTALMRGPSKELVMETSQRGKKLEGSVETLQVALDEKDEKLSQLSAELATAQEKLATRDARENELVKQLASKQDSDEQPTYSRETPARATLSQSESTESEGLEPAVLKKAKQTFNSSLDDVQKLIHQRKEMLDAAKARRREISVKIQPLVSKSGESLDALRVKVKKIQSQSEIDAITKGLGDIRALLDQDIALLRRLS